MFDNQKYYYNKTKCPQIMDSNGIQQRVIMPNMLFMAEDYNIKNWEPFEEFDIALLSGQKVVTIYRQYALGDIIQLIAVARIFKQQYQIEEIRIITSNRYIKYLQYLFSDIKFYSDEIVNWITPDFGFVLNLNGILERDHDIQNCDCYNHRVHNMIVYLGCNHVYKSDLDWSYRNDMRDVKLPLIQSTLPIIGLQIRGSGKLKTLPFDYIKRIATDLSKKYTVVLIDHDKDKGFEGKNIINLCGKLEIVKIVKLLKTLDCCITMDSGILWLCHVANCPVVTLLASTRESERLTLHPQYPNKAKSVNLAKMVDCEPCFETMCNCNGKIRCMNDVDCGKIITEINSKIKSILE